MSVLTVNAGSGSLQVHVVRDGEVAASGESVEDLAGTEGITAVGHRLVHGGPVVAEPAVLDDKLILELWRHADLAPLHNPKALSVVAAARAVLPDVPHVVCPDTRFHRDLPEVAATYPLPQDWRERWGLRRYGFHGLSYAWALGVATTLLGVEDPRLVMTHLGGGASVCAVRGGRSVDTSMGFTPLEGLPMSTRSGTVDPGMLLWLLSGGRLTPQELEYGLEHRSGLLGVSGTSGDTRDLVADDSPGARLALDVFAHRVAREIAAAATSLDRLDGLVFTGEIGWDQPEVRAAVCARLPLLGVRPLGDVAVSADSIVSDGGVPVLVIDNREELQIARETLAVLGS